MGKEKVELVDILHKHQVVIRGSNEEGQRFVEALLERINSNLGILYTLVPCQMHRLDLLRLGLLCLSDSLVAFISDQPGPAKCEQCCGTFTWRWAGDRILKI